VSDDGWKAIFDNAVCSMREQEKSTKACESICSVLDFIAQYLQILISMV